MSAPPPFVPPSPEIVAAVQREAERLVTPEELREALDTALTRDEIDEVHDLVRWFTTRYPTADARLAWARRRYAQWKRSIPHER